MAANSYYLSANPIVKKLQRIDQHDETNSCTYAGISRKLVLFSAMVVGGVLLNLLLKLTGAPVTVAEGVTVTSGQMAVLALCLAIMAICPFISVFITVTIPVTGSAFCAATGYMLSWLGGTFGGEYADAIRLSLVLTAIIVFVMAFLYYRGIVRAGNKLRTVMYTLLFSSIICGFFIAIAALIPATRSFAMQIVASPLLNIGFSLIYIVIGALFLAVDFDTIDRVVAEDLPKKYEWLAAYSLAFSVIWLYFKVLDLVLRLRGSSNKK